MGLGKYDVVGSTFHWQHIFERETNRVENDDGMRSCLPLIKGALPVNRNTSGGS